MVGRSASIGVRKPSTNSTWATRPWSWKTRDASPLSRDASHPRRAEQGKRLAGLQLVAVVAVAGGSSLTFRGGQYVEFAEHLLEGLPAFFGEEPLLPCDPGSAGGEVPGVGEA